MVKSVGKRKRVLETATPDPASSSGLRNKKLRSLADDDAAPGSVGGHEHLTIVDQLRGSKPKVALKAFVNSVDQVS